MDIYMSGTFSITTDPLRHLVFVTLDGFFERARVEALRTALLDVRAGLSCPPNEHLMLVDCSGMHIQSQEMVAAFTAAAREPTLRSRRAAVVVGKSLVNAQARRVFKLERDHVSFFLDRHTAEEWLMIPPVSAVQTASRYRRGPVLPMSVDRGYIARNGA
jgi:hypothetical protein